jgi:hypothetical protein
MSIRRSEKKCFVWEIISAWRYVEKASRGRSLAGLREEISVGGTLGGSENVGVGGFGGGSATEEWKNPCPVSGAGPSTLRGLFHPNASTLAELHFAEVSAVLNLG